MVAEKHWNTTIQHCPQKVKEIILSCGKQLTRSLSRSSKLFSDMLSLDVVSLLSHVNPVTLLNMLSSISFPFLFADADADAREEKRRETICSRMS